MIYQKDIENLPRLLDVKAVKKEFFSGQVILNMNAIYDMFHREDFPKIMIGKKLFTPTHLFIQWLDEQAKGTKK